ncbi:MAG: site-specific DNA-methyltransferase [Nitrospirae bacterium]|nr:site-specific DNA-methyltransferase [Nitrospirota bacterium]
MSSTKANTKTVSAFLSQFTNRSGSAPLQQNSARPHIRTVCLHGHQIPQYINEFWTAKQRQASSIHEISYRACFKPQLPAFFIDLLTNKNDFVYDPFSGRGTTVIEAGILSRRIISNDINPLNQILAMPRFFVPRIEDIAERLNQIKFRKRIKSDLNLSMFYHPDTLTEILSLKQYLLKRKEDGSEDMTDRWIRMVATNRLTGHSSGFFSVYTFPPNQAITRHEQVRINKQRQQTPEYRDVKAIILKKTRTLLKNVTEEQKNSLNKAGNTALFLTKDAAATPEIGSKTVQLTVTSPPFLDIVTYSKDNWLRCWFNGMDAERIADGISTPKSITEWSIIMGRVFHELYRITRQDGWVAFEVGEVRKGTIRLDEYVVPLGIDAGFSCEGIVINMQEFTKTSNIWGVSNNTDGTNTNRIVLFHKR